MRPYSNKRAWWLCPECGNEWDAIIQSRTRGNAGCPECARKRASSKLSTPNPGESLAELDPELAAQWHPTKNGPTTPETVTANSRKRIWWVCATCGNEWEASVYTRSTGYGCKACATSRSAVIYSKPAPGQSLAEQDPELASQWHPALNDGLTPGDVTRSSGKKVWWRCEKGHSWQAFINNRIKARGCPKCILWGTSVEEIRLRHELMAAGVPVAPDYRIAHPKTGRALLCDIVAPEWSMVIEFDGNRFHKSSENYRKDRRKTTALTEAGWTVIRVREDLEPIGPHDVIVPLLSSEVVRAKAVLNRLHQLGHTVTRYRDYLHTDSPWASDAAEAEVRRPRARSLASELPALAAEWDAEKNAPYTPEDVTPGSGMKAWWLCGACGRSWDARVYSRARGHGCDSCARRRRRTDSK